MGSLNEKSATNSLLEAAIASGLTHFESIDTINIVIKVNFVKFLKKLLFFSIKVHIAIEKIPYRR